MLPWQEGFRFCSGEVSIAVKTRFIFPPVAALVLVSAWTGFQRRSIAGVEKETAALREAIATAREAQSTAETDRGASATGVRGGPGGRKTAINWMDLAGRLEAEHSEGNSVGMRTMIEIQRRLVDLSAEELAAALDEIEALDLSPQVRKMLENALIGIYIEQAPKEALMRFADRLRSDPSNAHWQLGDAFGKWAKDDPGAALEWFDREIGEGTFDSKALDGRSQARLRFEVPLWNVLLETDPAGVAARVAALPGPQRKEALEQMDVLQLDAAKYAGLVRASLVEEGSAEGVFASTASRMAHGGDYGGVERFLNEAGLSSSERAVAVESAAMTKVRRASRQRLVPREEIEDMREWAGRQLPGSQDRLTGKVLAENGRHAGFSETAAIAVEYHESSGNDDVLAEFLKGEAARSNKEEAGALVDKISDQALRQELMEILK